ncbi:hypothetical protein D3C87_1841970 [compost metagenome]
MIPALLTTTSILPSPQASTSLIRRSTSSALETSAWMAFASPPCCAIASTTASAAEALLT